MPHPEPSSPARPAESAPTLLLVDDEPAVLSALRRLFRADGYRILQAHGGDEGLAVLAANDVDLVVSDMRMPGMDGAAFLEGVRKHDPTIMRILLTGYADMRSTIDAINRGEIHRYFSKPWNDTDVKLAVRETLSRRELERRNVALAALTLQQNEQLHELNQTLEARVAQRTAELAQVNAMLQLAYSELNSNFKLAVTVFSGLMEMRQDGIAGHSRRVAALARDTAACMGLPQREQEDVFLAALLHDIGKIGYPDKMLGKSVSAYAPDELSRYRRHPLDGEAALMPLSQLQGVARIVRQHHERFDGKGFPDGLSGTEICVGARIVAVASDFDGLVHGNLGERRQSVEQARQALRGGVGSRYDAIVVEAFLRVQAEHAQAASDDTEVDVRDLRPGMVLAQDLLSATGIVLLAAGYLFVPRVVRQVADFADREGLRLSLRVRRDTVMASGASRSEPRTSQAVA